MSGDDGVNGDDGAGGLAVAKHIHMGQFATITKDPMWGRAS